MVVHILWGDVLFRIAIDGPAGSGKSTIASRLADRLNIDYVDSGSIYRAITRAIIDNRINYKNIAELTSFIQNLNIEFDSSSISVNGVDFSAKIRVASVNSLVSEVAAISVVRKKVNNILGLIAEKQNVIMDGRDIGTVIIPDAELKIFLNASVEERARRRFFELNNGEDLSYEDVLANIIHRDNIDSSREDSPLTKAADAIEIDTTKLTIDDIIRQIMERISSKNYAL